MSIEWEKYVIAQDDDNDYGESGYVVCVKDNDARIGHYGHCSCYGTWDDGVLTWLWEGSLSELYKMALNQIDPVYPGRKSDPEDSDYDHLMAVYSQTLKYFKEKGVALNAKMARELTNKNREVVNDLYVLIAKEATKGKDVLAIDYQISDIAADLLRDNGYTVDTSSSGSLVRW